MNKCKKSVGVILIILFFLLSFTTTVKADTLEIIRCEDKNLYNALCEILPGAEGNDVLKTITISSDMLSGIIELDLSGKQISNLKGIEKIQSLTDLNLSNNKLTDISYLSDLPNLNYLNLSQNEITSLSALKDKSFETIIVNNNKLSSLDDLSGVTSLINLYANDNVLTSIDGLEEVEGLKEVYVANNRINDVSKIIVKDGLQVLNVSNNKISKISVSNDSESSVGTESEGSEENSDTTESDSLKRLNLSSNQIDNIDFLRSLDGLTDLDLSKNKIRIIPEFFANIMLNNKIGTLNLTEQNAFIVTQDKEMLFDKYSGYTNLLFWGYYFNGQDLSTTIDNGELNVSNLSFKFTDVSKDASIVIHNDIFAGSKITISYGGTKPTTATTNTATNTNKTNTTKTENEENTNTAVEEPNEDEVEADGTTAEGKMPYTGITSKVVGISSLAALLGLVVVYTHIQNKKNRK